MTINQHVFEDFTMREDFHTKILLGVLILLDTSKKNPTKSNPVNFRDYYDAKLRV